VAVASRFAGPLRSAVGGGRSYPERAVVPASPRAARGPNRPILSGTASEDRLAPTARSADITWSRGPDEVFGSHGYKASASGSATWSRPSWSGRSCVPPGSAPRPARPDLEAGPARPGRRHPRGRFRTRGHGAAAPAPPRPDRHRALAAAPAGPVRAGSPFFAVHRPRPWSWPLEYGCSRLHQQRMAWRQAGLAAGPPAGRGDL
jgi:hypothetical protein